MPKEEAFSNVEIVTVETQHEEAVEAIRSRLLGKVASLLDNTSSYAIGASLGLWGAYFADAYFATEVAAQAAEKIGISLDTPFIGPLIQKAIIAIVGVTHLGSMKAAPYLLTAGLLTKSLAKAIKWYLA